MHNSVMAPPNTLCPNGFGREHGNVIGRARRARMSVFSTRGLAAAAPAAATAAFSTA